MTSVHYAIGFTLATCLSFAFGINDTSTYTQQALLMFSGFCAGGIAVILIEEL